MKIDESNYDVFLRIESKDINVNINWKDAENIEGYISIDEMFNIIQDLVERYGVLEEKYYDLLDKIEERFKKVKEENFLNDMVDRWMPENYKANALLSDEEKTLKDFLGEKQ